MNKCSLVISVLTLLLGLVVSGKSAAGQAETAGVKTTESPFACNRLALTPEQRKRHFEEVGPKLLSLKKAVRELRNGYEFEFPSDAATVHLATEWAIAERACCPFFDIELRLEREGGPFWLRVTGREGVKDFIRADGAAWVRK